MSDDSIGSLIWNTSPQVYNSLKQSNASDDTLRRAAAASRLLQQHKSFIGMPDAEARTSFQRLPETNRQALIDFMGDQNYNKAKVSSWQKLKSATNIPSFGELLNGFQKYAWTQTNLYRVSNLKQEQLNASPEAQAQFAEVQERVAQTPLVPGAGMFPSGIRITPGKDKTQNSFEAFLTADQWNTTFNGEQYFDKDKEKEVESKYSPAVSKVAKLFAMGKAIQEIMSLVETPEEEQAFIAYMDPQNGKQSEVYKAIDDFDHAKVSPGRDLAYGLREYDRKSKIPDRYDIVSGLTDAAFLVATDPSVVLVKALSAIKVARFGLMKLAGADGIKLSTGLDKMFKATSVRNYWNEVGTKVGQYADSKNLQAKAQIAADLGRDFGIDVTKKVADDASEIVAVDFIEQLAKAGVRDADSALSYLKNAGVTELISMGRVGGVEPLMPRKTVFSSTAKNLRNTTAALIGLRKAPDLPAMWDNADELARNFENIGDLKQFRSAAGNLNKIFSKAVTGKEIVLDTAESATDIFRMARLIVDPYHANIIKQAWREGDVATRLRLFDGIAINVGKKFGLTDDEIGKLYSRTGTQLYSEDLTAFSKGSTALGQVSNLGRRTGLTETQLATTASLSKGALADLNTQLKESRTLKKDLKAKLKELEINNASFTEIDTLKEQIGNLDKKIGGLVNKSKTYRKATGDDVAKEIRGALFRAGYSTDDVNTYTDILRKGVLEDVDQYEFQQILGTVYDAISNDKKLGTQLSKNIDGFEVVDFDQVFNYVAKAFPSAEEVAQRLGQTAYNPAQLGDSQYALGYWQLSNKVAMPNFAKWSIEANSKLVGTSRYLGQKIVNGWSWATLIPRLGIRSAIEELGLFGIAVPFGDLHRILIGKKISTEYRYATYGEASLGFINRTMATFLRSGESKITPAQRKLLQQDPSQLPALIAKNVARNKAVMLLSGFDTKTVERWVDDWFSLPYGTAALDEINEGALATLNLTEAASDQLALRAEKIYGPITQWNFRAEEAAANIRSTGEFDTIRNGDYGFDIGWLNQIKLRLNHTTNLGWGKIVLANIYNEEKAVKALVDNFKKNPEIMNKFVLFKAVGPEEFARRQYKFIVHPFTKNNGLLNEKLVNKVRKTVIDPATGKSRLDINAENLTIRDLDEFVKLERPETILGIKYIPTTAASNLVEAWGKGMSWAMNWMGKQISVLGREPALFANYQVFRKRLITAEADMAERYVAQGMSREAAEKTASKWASNVAGDLATNRTLQYVDNPNVRTNLAFTMRNLARYYRATEDFYRRAGRVVRYDPLAIAKFRLLTTGLEDTGWIHRDDQGEPYFVYPGDEIIFTAVGLGMRLLGQENALRQPQPAQFTGKMSMLTPSLDPEAGIPTLSGPISATLIWAIEQWLPESEQMAFRKKILGKYSVDRTLPELLLPTSVNRFYNAFLNYDERASQYASAVRKSHMFYAANGIMKKFIDQAVKGGEERAAAVMKYNQYVNTTARNIAVARNMFGLVAPASPQADFGLDVPEWVREQSNITNLKPEFQKLVEQYGNDPLGIDKAQYKWSRLFPGKAIYTLTESEKTGIGTVKATQEAVEWIKGNKRLVNAYPEAVRFIVPSNGKYDLEAYAFLQDQGFSEMKTIEKFATEANTFEDYFYWRQVKNFSDLDIANAQSPAEKKALQARWESWSKQYRAQNPHVQVYLDNIVRNDQAKKNTITELYNMYQKGDMPNTDSNQKLVKMMKLYNEFTSKFQAVQGRTDEEVAYRKNLRKDALELMLEYAGSDDQALAAYRTLFDPLIGE